MCERKQEPIGNPQDASHPDPLRRGLALFEQSTDLKPKVALILGSGAATAISDLFSHPTQMDFCDLTGLPTPSTPGHRSEVYVGMAGEIPTLVFGGRLHLYQGLSAADVTRPVQLAAALGCEVLIQTNAAGGIRDDLEAGSLMLIEDHINLQGQNPLVRSAEHTPAFVDMSQAYDLSLQALAHEAAAICGFTLNSGVYAAVTGPSYETPAEIRMLRALGADAVGMSTAPETIAARREGLKVLAITCITNKAAGLGSASLTHEDVLAKGRQSSGQLAKLLHTILTRMPID